jgi:hypothetical protein
VGFKGHGSWAQCNPFMSILGLSGLGLITSEFTAETLAQCNPFMKVFRGLAHGIYSGNSGTAQALRILGLVCQGERRSATVERGGRRRHRMAECRGADGAGGGRWCGAPMADGPGAEVESDGDA